MKGLIMKRFFALIPVIALVVALFVSQASAAIAPGYYEGWYYLEDGYNLDKVLDGAFVLIPIEASYDNFNDIVHDENYANLEFAEPFYEVTTSVAFISGVVSSSDQAVIDAMLFPVYGSIGMTLLDFPLSAIPSKGFYVYVFGFTAPSVNNDAVLTPVDPPNSYDGIFGDLYYMLADAVYGGTENISGYQDLILTAFCTIAVVLMIVLPFLLVWVIISTLGVWR